MDINVIIKMYNEEGKNLNDIAKFYGKGKSTIQRFLVKNGYSFNSKLKKYEKLIYENGIKMDNVLFETNSDNKKEKSCNEILDNVSCEMLNNETMVNGSYTIPYSLNKALKIKAVMEDKKVIDIVRYAIEKVVEEKYYKF